jgi:CHAD domain-containing protein
MRVASRRLRSAFPLFAMCLPAKKQKNWLQQIKQVTRALGEARDADVQIDRLQEFAAGITLRRHHAGIDRLLLRLRQQRQRLQPGLQQAMQTLRESRVLEEMTNHFTPLAARQEHDPQYTSTLYRHAFMAISASLEAFLAYDSIVNMPERVEELHAMRISAKHLRYTIENLAPLYGGKMKPYLQAVRKAQEILGDIHDCDVWIEFLPRFMEEEKQRILDFYTHTRPYPRLVSGLEHFRQDRQAMRERQYNDFVIRWQHWKDENLWAKLGYELRAPFFKESLPAVPTEGTDSEPSAPGSE